MGVTIKDVAMHAGVSIATVSRYLNNSPFIAHETSEKIRGVMQELKYSPNSIARSFVNQTTNTVAFIVDSNNKDSFGNPYFLQIQYGIEKILGSRGYYLMIVNVGNKSNGESILDRLITEKRVDGIILPALLAKRNLVRKIYERNFPCVVFGQLKDNTDISWVDLDNVMGGELATDHLVKNGCQKIAFVGCDLKHKFAAQRLQGYRNAIMRNGHRFIQDNVLDGYIGKEKGSEIIEELLSRKDHPDGFIFSDNVAAFGAISTAKDMGVKIPDEIQIVSFDDYMVSVLSEPKMTVVDIDVFDLGAQAATMLLKQFDSPSLNKQQSMISVKLISRGSSKNTN